jgi:PAS domain S-box-containing protein
LAINPYLIAPAIAFLINFFTMAYASALNMRNPVNRAYVMLSVVISLWVLCSAAFHLPLCDPVIVPFSKLSSLFWYLTGFLFTHFTYVFLRRRRDFFYYASLGASIICFIIAVSTDLVVSGYHLYPWGWRFREGVFFIPATLLAIVLPIITSWILALRYRQSTGDPVRRRQITPLLAGTIFTLGFAAANEFLLPYLPGFEHIVRYTASWSVLLSIFVFYTIIRHRFLTPGVNDIATELFASSKDGVAILSSTGRVLNINAAGLAILNIDGSKPSSLRIERLIEGFIPEGTYYNHLTTTSGPGDKRTLLINQSEVRAGNISIGRILIIHDITDLARMNESLRESNELFTLITNNVADVIWIYNLALSSFSYVSPSIQKRSGWTPDEFLDLQFSDIVTEETLAQIIGTISEEIAHDREREPARTRAMFLKEKTRTGSIIDVEVRASFIRNAAGAPVAILGVTRDISDRMRLEKELRASLRQLKERNDIIESDLKTAQMVLRALLPDEAPSWDRLLIDFRYRPLEAIGGDYFNIQPLSEGGLSLFLCDVTGHGITAALFLSLLKSISTSHLRKLAHDPPAYLSALNTDIHENMYSYFVSGVYGIFSSIPGEKSLTLAVSSGGHPQPILHGSGTESPVYLATHGKLIGLKRDISFPSIEITLQPGDRVYFYTDGIPEMSNTQGEYLGYERLLEIVSRSGAMPLGEALDAIMSAAHEFRGSAQIADDIVIIGVEVI